MFFSQMKPVIDLFEWLIQFGTSPAVLSQELKRRPFKFDKEKFLLVVQYSDVSDVFCQQRWLKENPFGRIIVRRIVLA